MKKKLLSILLVLALTVVLAVPAMAADQVTTTDDLEVAIGSSASYIQLGADIALDADLQISNDVYLDLNGYDITGHKVVIERGAKLYLKDTVTNRYTSTDYGKLEIVDNNADASGVVAAHVASDDGYRYITVKDAVTGMYSSHRIYLAVKSVVLPTDAVGINYKLILNCSDYVASQVASYGAYFGTDASTIITKGTQIPSGHTVKGAAGDGNTVVMSIQGQNESNANATIFACAYITLKSGNMITSSVKSISYQAAVETLDSNFATYDASAQVALVNLYEDNVDMMSGWNSLTNLPSHNVNCICGSQTDIHLGDCDGSDATWSPWKLGGTDGYNTLPNVAGNYYLVDNDGDPDNEVTITGTASFSGGPTVMIDLNGVEVISSASRMINGNGGGALNLIITDSSTGHTGKLISTKQNGDQGVIIWARANQNLTVYRATLDASQVTSQTSAGGTVVNIDGSGGSVSMYSATVKGGALTNTAGHGTAIWCGVNGLTLDNTTVYGGPAGSGGTAIYCNGITNIQNGSEVYGYTGAATCATANGGTILIEGGTLTVTNSTVTATDCANGGAIFLTAGTLKVENGAQITAANLTELDVQPTNGGAVYANVDGVTVNISGGTVTGTSVTGNGGAICLYNGGDLTMTGGAVTGGSAANGGNVIINGASTAVLDLSGGTIQGGTADTGDNLWANVATFNLSGSAKIVNGDAFIFRAITLGNWEGNGDEKVKVIMQPGTGKVATPANANVDFVAASDCFDCLSTYAVICESDGIYIRDPGNLLYNCVCGANDGEAHVGECNGLDIAWSPWPIGGTDGHNTLPNVAGNYYLVDNDGTNDSIVTVSAWVRPTEEVNIAVDLNGLTVNSTAGRVYDGFNNQVLDVVITDSSVGHTGQIVATNTAKTETGRILWARATTQNYTVYRATLDASGVTSGSGAIHASGNIYLYNATVKGVATSTGSGCAINMDNADGSLTIINSEIYGGNAAVSGGAIYTKAPVTISGEDTLITAQGKTTVAGGAIYATTGSADITFNDGTIIGGVATNLGGAVYCDAGGALFMNGGSIYGGSAVTGGNIYINNIEGSEFIMSAGQIYGGTATGQGANAWIRAKNFKLSGSARIYNGGVYQYCTMKIGNWAGNGATKLDLDVHDTVEFFAVAENGTVDLNNYLNAFEVDHGYYVANGAGGLRFAGDGACLCGGGEDEGHLAGCNGETMDWSAWKLGGTDGHNTLPNVAGNYYLVDNDGNADGMVTITGGASFSDGPTVVVDLNGLEVTTQTTRAFSGNNGGSLDLTITDSSAGHTGKIISVVSGTSTQGNIVWVRAGQKLTVYRATLDATSAISATTAGGTVVNCDGGNATVTMYNATVKGGQLTDTSGNGAAIHCDGALTLDNTVVYGGQAGSGGTAIRCSGTTNIQNGSQIYGYTRAKTCKTANGGTILVEGGTLTVSNSTVTATNCANGGAVYLAAGTLNIENGTNVTAANLTELGIQPTNGGAVYANADGVVVNISGGTVTGTTVAGSGGTIYLYTNAGLTMTGGTIQGGTANTGDNLWADVATFNLSGDTRFVDGDIFIFRTITLGEWEGNGDTKVQVVMQPGTGKVATPVDANVDLVTASDSLDCLSSYVVTCESDGIYIRDPGNLLYSCVCGANDGELHMGDCNGMDIAWQPWKLGGTDGHNTLPNVAGNYYLVDNDGNADNHVLINTASFTDGPTVRVNFNGVVAENNRGYGGSVNSRAYSGYNGGDVNLILTDSSVGHTGGIKPTGSKGAAQGNGVWVRDGQTLTAYRITIDASAASNTSSDGGTAIHNNSTVRLYGVTVKGGSTTGVGGAIYSTEMLVLVDTTIVGGVANQGGSVYMYSGTLEISGNTSITGGTNISGNDDNLYMCGATLKVTGPLSSAARIGVNTMAGEGVVAYGTYAAQALNCFTYEGTGTLTVGTDKLYIPGTTYRVGYGIADITPSVEDVITGLSLTGYGNLDTRITDSADDIASHIYATCLAATDAEGDTVLIINIDTTSPYGSDRVRRLVSRATGVPFGNIMISASHQHSSPNPADTATTSWLTTRNNGIVQAAVNAMANRATTTEVYTASVNVGINKFNFVRNYDVYLNGVKVGTSSPNHNEVTITSSHVLEHESDVDDEVQLVKFVRPGADTITIANFQTHPHLSVISSSAENAKISADLIGYFRDKLSALTGTKVIYYSGAGGNVNPYTHSSLKDSEQIYPSGEAGAKAHGEALAVAVANATYTRTSGLTDVEIISQTNYYDMLDDKPTATQLAIANDYASYTTAQKRANKVWSQHHANSMLRRYNEITAYRAELLAANPGMDVSNAVPSRSITISAATIGDIAFAIAPYEMFDTNGYQIKHGYNGVESPYDMTFVASQANNNKGYIPSALGYANGGYSTDVASFAAGTGEALVVSYLELLNALKNR